MAKILCSINEIINEEETGNTYAFPATDILMSDKITTVESAINGKAPTTHTHKGTQITGLTTNRALVSNASGQVAVANVTATELGYLDGVTSNIQSQLNNKTDTKVTNTLATTTKAYLTGTTSATTNTGTQVFDTGVYLDTIAGRLRVGSLDIGGGVMSYSSSTQTFSI